MLIRLFYSFYDLPVEACVAAEKTVVGTDFVVETIVGAAESNDDNLDKFSREYQQEQFWGASR